MNVKTAVMITAAVLLCGCQRTPEVNAVPAETPAEITDPVHTVTGNLLKITDASDFEAGSCTGLVLNPDIGDGALRLADGITEGFFVSAVYEAAAFTEMNACWNAAVYDGGEVEIYARARYGETWTEYLTWGPYTPFESRGTKEGKQCSDAEVDHDLFRMKDERTADAVQMKAVLRRKHADDASPVLRMLSMTFRGAEMTPAYAEERIQQIPEQVMIPAEALSQLRRAPAIADYICSPTVMSIMLNSRMAALQVLPEELALNSKDEGEGIFGNWSFCVASAGLYGFEAYTQFGNCDIILQELARGNPVCINVSYTDKKDTDLPYLEGVTGSTEGHLICLHGYEYEDGIHDEEHLVFFVCDSFSETDEDAERVYRWSQLQNCYKGMTYIMPARAPEVRDGAPGIMHTEAELHRDEEHTDAWYFAVNGERIDMDRFINGGGILAYTVQDTETALYYDISCNADGSLVLNRAELLEKAQQPDRGQTITVYAFSDRGITYSAQIR